MNIDAATLEDAGLLRIFRGRRQYKFSLCSGWMTANSQESAIEYASKAYESAPPDQRLTAQQRAEAADRAEFERSDAQWGHMPLPALKDMLARTIGSIPSFRRAASREFNGNGGRRTSAAVAAEGARDCAETAMRLGRYVAIREQEACLTRRQQEEGEDANSTVLRRFG